MPKPTILIESYNLSLTRGTGIATYARNLARAVEASGHRAEGLFDVPVGIDRRNPDLSEILMFDALRPGPSSALGRAAQALRREIGDPFGVRTMPIVPAGAVAGQALLPFQAFGRSHGVPGLIDRARRHFYRYGRLLPVRHAEPAALFHATHAVPLKAAGLPSIATIHDIVPLRHPQTTLDDKRFFYRLVKRLLAEMDHIVTVSEFSRQDIMAMFGVPADRITNTYQAVRLPPGADKDETTLAHELQSAYGLEKDGYFLFYGALEPKKNVGRLVEAYAGSGARIPLVIAGGLGWQYDEDLARIGSERFRSYRVDGGTIRPEHRVIRLDYVPASRLASLIRGARAVTFPSIYEGFGLPVLEAMLLGTPVLTSTLSSLPEVAGDAALLVDPYDVDAIAAGLRRLDGDADLRAELVRRGRERAALFSEERYAEAVGTVYRRLV